MNANHIVVVDNGILIEQGTHDQLLSHKGKYADLWEMQIPPGWKHKDTNFNNMKGPRTIGFEVRRQLDHITASTANYQSCTQTLPSILPMIRPPCTLERQVILFLDEPLRANLKYRREDSTQ